MTPADALLTTEQRDLIARARAVADGPLRSRAAEVDETGEYPWDAVEHLRAAGFLGMTVPRELGGVGASCLDVHLVVEQIARACAVSARIVVESNLGAIGAVMRYGTPAQRDTAARVVLEGDKPAICITERAAGSEATAMTTTAVEDADGYVLDGSKCWITGGGVSRLHLVFARVVDRNGDDQGIGGFFTVRDGELPGLEVGRRERTMGLRGIPETELHFRGLRLPTDALLRTPGWPHHGFRDLMQVYNGQRVGAASVALGIAQGAWEVARAFTGTRRQFGRNLSDFQGIRWKLADMATGLASARALLRVAAASAGAGGLPDPLLSAQAKVVAAETAVRVTNDALQLHGANGYSRDLPLERMVRDARMFTIGGGTVEVLRNQIAGWLLVDDEPPALASAGDLDGGTRS